MSTIIAQLFRLACGVALLLLVLAWAPAPAHAARAADASSASEDAVRAAVETFVRYVTADARPDAIVERMEPYQVKGVTVAYIVHLRGGGFCLTSADERLAPVYLYSPSGTYDPASPDYRFVLEEIATRTLDLQDGRLTLAPAETAERAATWDDLIAGRVPEAPTTPASPVSMVLPLTSQWHQGSPYNDQCPVLTPGSDEHVVVGCVATAVAQIMYYWKWPFTGTGSDTVTYERRYRTTWDTEPLASDPEIPAGWAGRLEYDSVNHRLRMNGWWDFSVYADAKKINSSAAYQNALAALWSRMNNGDLPLTVNMGAATYNWNIMTDTNSDPPTPAANEAAKVSYHAAVGVHMYFTVGNSSANGGGARSALVEHFRYAPTVRSHEPPVANLLIAEIQWLRPVWLGGVDPGVGGHAWVGYGYNSATNPPQFKMNVGWGDPDGFWYSLDQFFPDAQADITYIAPLNVKFVGTSGSGDGSPPNPYGGIEAALASGFSDGTLIFQADSVNTFSAATLTIDRPLTLKGQNATIRRATVAAAGAKGASGSVAPAAGPSAADAKGTSPLTNGLLLVPLPLLARRLGRRPPADGLLSMSRPRRSKPAATLLGAGRLAVLAIPVVFALALAFVLPGTISHAQTGGGYDLTWHLAGGAGGAMSGGGYTLAGSAGQAGASILSGGGYTLNGGFWVSDWHPSNWLYLPLTLKGGS